MTALAAIDRVVHQSVVPDLMSVVQSYRANGAARLLLEIASQPFDAADRRYRMARPPSLRRLIHKRRFFAR
jgi:hypothetical protein